MLTKKLSKGSTLEEVIEYVLSKAKFKERPQEPEKPEPAFSSVYLLECSYPTSIAKLYIGSHGDEVPFEQDDYWSSSDIVKACRKEWGSQYFTKTLLCYCETRYLATVVESMLHYYFEVDTNPLFFNRGKQNPQKYCSFSPSEQTRQKLRQALKGRIISQKTRDAVSQPRSEETKKKLSEAAKLRPKRTLSEEHKANIGVSSKAAYIKMPEQAKLERGQKISQKLKGVPKSEQARQNMSNKVVSDQARQNMSKAQMGKKKPPGSVTQSTRDALSKASKGVPKSAEHKQKLSEAARLRSARNKAAKEAKALELIASSIESAS